MPAPCAPFVAHGHVHRVENTSYHSLFEHVPDSVYVAATCRTAAWRSPTVAKFLCHLPLRFSPRERVGYRLHNLDTTTHNRGHVHFTQICFIRTRHGVAGCCACPHAAFACDNRVGLGTGHKLGVCVDCSRSWISDCLRKL